MKQIKRLLFFFLTAILLTSCLKEEDKTLVLPKVVYATPIEQVVPISVLTKIENNMPVYKGYTPPDITGVYLINPYSLVYSSDGQFSAGHTFTDGMFRFLNQNSATHILSYEMKEGSAAEEKSDSVSVSGSGSNFTAYFVAYGTTNGIYTKTATVITGVKSSSGIQNYYEAFVMLDKGSDPKGLVMDVNEYRIFKDGNDLASNTTWVLASKAPAFNSSLPVMQYRKLTKYETGH